MALKRLLLIATICMVAFSSCLRDEDKDMLNCPIHITGEIDPHYGLPIAYTEMDVNDVLGLLGDYDQYIDITSDDELITLHFDTSFAHRIEFGLDSRSKKGCRKGGIEEDSIVYSYDTVLRGEQTFNDLENLEIMQNISLTQMIINLGVDVSAEVNEATLDMVNNYGVYVYVDSIMLKAYNEDDPSNIFELSHYVEDSLSLNQLISGTTTYVPLLEEVDAAELINIIPNKVEYAVSTHLRLADTLFTMDFEQFLQDSLKLTALDIVSNISTRFPINMKVKDFEYTLDTTEFNISNEINSYFEQLDSIEGLEAEIEKSFLTIKLENGLPLDVKLCVDICDSNFNSLFKLIDTTAGFLPAPPIKVYNNDPHFYVSNGTSINTVQMELNQQRLEQMRYARKMIFTVVASTPASEGEQQQVALCRSNKLGMKVYAKIHAKAAIDIPLTDGPIKIGGAKGAQVKDMEGGAR